MSTKKILSIFLALCMVMALFSCLSVPAMADGEPEDFAVMLRQPGWENYRATYWKNVSLTAGNSYIFAMDFAYLSDEGPNDVQVYLYSIESGSRVEMETVSSFYAENAYPTEAGSYRKLIRFTLADEAEVTTIGVKVGNYSSEPFYAGNPALYDANRLWQPIEGSNEGRLSMMDSKRSGVPNGPADWSQAEEYWNVRASGSAGGLNAIMGNMFLPYDDSLFLDPIEYGLPNDQLPQSPFDQGAYSDQGVSKTAVFKAGAAAAIHYYNDNREIIKGEMYSLTFEAKLFAGTGLYAQVLVNGVDQYAEGEFDDATNTYIAIFEATDSTTDNTAGGLQVVIGTNDAVTNAWVAKPVLKLLDANGNPTGANLIHDIAANTVAAIGDGVLNTTTNKIWNRDGGSNTAGSETVIYKNYTVANPNMEEEFYRITFNGVANTKLYYINSAANLPAGTYRLTVDYRAYYADQLDGIAVLLDDVAVAGTSNYDDAARKWTVTFTTAATAEKLEIYIGNDSATAVASIGNATLKAVVAGEETGDSLIAGINNFTLDLSSADTAIEETWNTIGYSSSSLYTDELPANYFNPAARKSTALYFQTTPATIDDCQLLVYKDNHFRLLGGNPGTYRLRIKRYLVSGKDYYCIRFGQNLPSGNTRVPAFVGVEGDYLVFEQTFWGAQQGFGVLIGNYGELHEVFYDDVQLFRYEGGQYVGYNLLEPLTTDSIVCGEVHGMSEIKNGIWSRVNGKVEAMQLIDNEAFDSLAGYATRLVRVKKLLLGAEDTTAIRNPYDDMDSDGTITILDLVKIKKAAAAE